MRHLRSVLASALFIVVVAAPGSAHAGPGATTLISVSNTATPGNGSSSLAAIGDGFSYPDDSGRYSAADGLIVGFRSTADNLVSSDSNGAADAFVHSVIPFVTTSLVSVSNNGALGNDAVVGRVTLSSQGRSAAFASLATNLVPGDTNAVSDVFVLDRQAGTTVRVSVGPGGSQANAASSDPSISSNGRYVTFFSLASNLVPGDTNMLGDVFVRDLAAGTTSRVSISSGNVQGNNVSQDPAISPGGRYVVFTSTASNLVPGDTNGGNDVFVRDLLANTTRRVSVQTGGAQAASSGTLYAHAVSICAGGRFIAFQSAANDLVPADTNGWPDVFVRDVAAGTTTLVSISTSNAQTNAASGSPALSADCGSIAFWSNANNLAAKRHERGQRCLRQEAVRCDR